MSLSPEDRDELATAAAIAERRNRPRGLVIFSGIVAGIALIALIWSALSLNAAQGAQDKQLELLTKTQSLAARWEGVQSAGQGDGSDIFVPYPSPRTKIEELATAAGIDKPALPDRSLEGQGTIKMVQFKYNNIRENDIAKVMRWIESVVQEIPGMFVEQLRIDPQPNNWNVSVTFSRWERQT